MVSIVRVDVSTTQRGGEAYDPDDRWTSYEPTYTELEDVSARICDISDSDYQEMVKNQDDSYATVWGDAYTINIQNPDGVTPGTPVYVVIVRYSSGDTFGHTDGLVNVYDVFATEAEAEALARVIREDADKRYAPKNGIIKEWSLDHNGRKYHKCWVGYFEGFEAVEVYPVMAF